MDSTHFVEVSFIVVEAIRWRCASFMSLPATVSEIFGGQTTPSILVVWMRKHDLYLCLICQSGSSLQGKTEDVAHWTRPLGCQGNYWMKLFYLLDKCVLKHILHQDDANPRCMFRFWFHYNDIFSVGQFSIRRLNLFTNNDIAQSEVFLRNIVNTSRLPFGVFMNNKWWLLTHTLIFLISYQMLDIALYSRDLFG